MTFPSVVGIYNIQSISFASRGSGNGFQSVQLQANLNESPGWVNMSGLAYIPSTISIVTVTNTLGVVTLGVPNLLSAEFHLGTVQWRQDLQNLIDNIQVNGVIVPEPATVAGGLLGVLGLCWFQRRRLSLPCRGERGEGGGGGRKGRGGGGGGGSSRHTSGERTSLPLYWRRTRKEIFRGRSLDQPLTEV